MTMSNYQNPPFESIIKKILPSLIFQKIQGVRVVPGAPGGAGVASRPIQAFASKINDKSAGRQVKKNIATLAFFIEICQDFLFSEATMIVVCKG